MDVVECDAFEPAVLEKGQCGAEGGQDCNDVQQVCDFDIVKATDMTRERFEKEYFDKKPFVISFENGASEWTDPDLWVPESLAKRHGNKFALGGYSEILVTVSIQ